MKQDNYNVSPFLSGGGEMGKLIREFDWAKTPLGPTESWPQSLRIVVGIILRSKFPMFLWWGPELIQFYNDAYRPSFGNDGKHPLALGSKGIDTWKETWPVIKPLIDSVLLTGESTWSEDQLIPIYRNGNLEDAYWTFSYSVVFDDDGKNKGVLVTCTETTEKILANNKLLEANAQLNAAIEASQLATWELNPITHKFTASNRLKEWFGLPLDKDLAYTDAVKAVAEKDRKRVSDAIAKALLWESGGGYLLEHSIINSETGEERVVRAIGQTTFDIQKQPLHFNGTIQDITESYVAKQKVEESEQFNRYIFYNSPVAKLVFVGENMLIREANEKMLEMLGRDASVIGKPLFDVSPELMEAGLLERYRKVTGTGETINEYGEQIPVIKEGKPYLGYYDYTYKPLKRVDGTIYGVMCTAVDVTSQVLSRQKLEEAELNMRGAVELAQLGTWSIDAATNGLTYSDRLIEWFGYDPAAQEYDQVIPILSDEDQQRVAKAVARALDPNSDGVYDEIYTVISPKTGKKKILHAQGKAIYDNNGKVIRMNGTAQDITIQRELQLALENQVQERTEELEATNEELLTTNEELFKLNDKLFSSNEELSQYAYVASHDLQEPLRKIQVYSDMLIKQKSTSEENKPVVTKIVQSAERMTLLIKDLLNFSRLTKAEESTASVDLNETLKDIVKDFELLISEKKATLNVGKLPKVAGVGLQMNQLFYNLISNSLKFTNPDVPPEINIEASELTGEKLSQYINKVIAGKTYYHITVKDNGIGFETKHADQIFEVFKRLHGKDVYPGSGIGLALCKRIVNNHSGVLFTESEPGIGTTFHIILHN